MFQSPRFAFWLYATALTVTSAVIWFWGPHYSVMGKAILASPWTRATLITLMVVVAEIIRLQPRNIRETTSFDPKIRAELSILRNGLAGAMRFLKKTKITVDDRKEMLHERPWHLMIGPEDSGKSALMANSGFKFILARKNAAQQTKSTRHVDWWVTREAVILDSCGGFTCHGNSPLQKKLWFTFLNWLKRNETTARIQSVMLVLNLGDLIRKNPAEQKKVFEDCHLRITEIQHTLNQGFQLHIIFTKCDQLSGFNAFFESLDANEREQCWGLVLPRQFQKPMIDHVQDAWQQFMTKCQERVLWRMHHERNLQKRAQIKDFPLQIEKTQSLIMDCISHLPPISDREDKDRNSLQLSGIFFTSTSQKEAAYDALLEPLTESFALAKYDEAVIVNPELNYFTHQLFSDIIFEGGKADQWRKQLAFQQGLRYGMYAAATGVIAVGTLALVHNFQNQLSSIDQAKQAMTEYQLLAKQAQMQPSLQSLLPALDALDRAQQVMKGSSNHVIKDVNAAHRDLPELMQRSYDKTVVTTIIPKLTADVEQQLKLVLGQPHTDRAGYFYTTLKVYQMLGKPEQAEIDVVERWLAQFWYENNIGDKRHLSQLKPHIAKAFMNLTTPVKINQHLSDQAKLYLNKLSQVDLAQAILADLTQTAMHSPLALPIALTETDNTVLHGSTTQIPYLYTHEGFYQGFVPHYQQAAQEAVMGNWILGAKLPPESANKHLAKLEKKLASAYASQYIQHWQNMLSNTRFAHFYSIKHAEKVLQHFPQGQSALSTLVAAVQTHTQFNQMNEPTPLVKTTAKQIHQQFRSVNDRLAQHPERFLENAFSQLQRSLQLMRRNADEFDASFQFSKTQFTTPQSLMSQLQFGIDELPTPMQAWFQGFVKDFWTHMLDNSGIYVQQQWQNVVWSEYEKRIAKRFPVSVRANKEISTNEFSQFYGPAGKVAQFFGAYVAPFVETNKKGKAAYWKTIANAQVPLSDGTLKVMNQLEKVQKQFFHGNKHRMEVNFSLIAIALSPTIENFSLKVDGHALEYPNGATSLGNVRWPNPRVRRHDVSISLQTDEKATKKRHESGPWALFKFLNQAKLESTDDPKRFNLTINLDKHALKYELIADSKDNPFSQHIFNNLVLPREI